MDRTEHIASLLYKHLQGTLSPAEQASLQAWLQEDPSHQALLAKNSDAAGLAHALQAWYQIPRTGLTDDPVLLKHIQPAKRHLALSTYLSIAATILLVIATAIYFYRSVTPAQDIAPGYNQATLTLADGTKVTLDSAQSGIIVQDEDIKYTNGNSIAFGGGRGRKTEGSGASGTYHVERTTYNSLSTPKGGQYQITLPDGTKVWLNAASTLKYPSKFTGDRREVFLEGEAYFSVAKSEKQKAKSQEAGAPFIVRSRYQEITVLGTSFNISAFADERETKTTLIEGKVQVRSENVKLKTYNVQLLKPAQQAVVYGDSLTVSKADVESAIAWKNGEFQFIGETLGVAMLQIARWYNVQVVFADEALKQAPVSAIISREEQLSAILHIFEKAGLKFKLEGRQLSIQKK